MFELLFLGTSASAPTIQRGLTASVVLHDEYRFLIDCGEGTQRQILKSGLGFKRLSRILLTHSHLDHILGLAGLVSTFLRWETLDNLEIYASEYTLRRVRTLLFDVVLGPERADMNLTLHAIQPGTFFEADDFTVTAVPVQHRGRGCLGYVFEERSKRPFLAEKADALGIPFGPQRRDLVQGQPVQLADGRIIQPDEVLGPPRPGTKLVYIGDTGRTDNLVEVCRGADMLVIESTYLQADAAMAKRYMHLTAQQAAELARKAGVKQLVLNHVSRRYPERAILEEAQKIFPQVSVARDFNTYAVK